MANSIRASVRVQGHCILQKFNYKPSEKINVKIT